MKAIAIHQDDPAKTAASYRAVGDWNAAMELDARADGREKAANRHWSQAKSMWALASAIEAEGRS